MPNRNGNVKENSTADIPQGDSSSDCFQVELKFGMLVFAKGGKLENLEGEKPLEQGREPITNSKHM